MWWVDLGSVWGRCGVDVGSMWKRDNKNKK